jgi:hypothetical protein
MKKIVMICIVAAFATSCKKDYSCVCTTVDTSGSTTETTVTTFKAKSKKKDAEEWCKAIPKSTIEVLGMSEPIYDGSTTCEVK